MGSNLASMEASQKVYASDSDRQAYYPFSPCRSLLFCPGLAQTAVDKANKMEVIPSSYFAASAATGSVLLSSVMSTLLPTDPGSNHVLLPWKAPHVCLSPPYRRRPSVPCRTAKQNDTVISGRRENGRWRHPQSRSRMDGRVARRNPQ